MIVDQPSEPENLELLAFDDTFVTMRWQLPMYSGGQALISFKVYRKDCTVSDTEPVLLATLPASQFTYTDASVTGGTDYEYHITASNTIGGEGLGSSPLKIAPIAIPLAPDAPTLIERSRTFISVQWSPPASDRGA